MNTTTRTRRRDSDRGMVTAELAIGAMVCAFLAMLACWVVGLLVLQTRCGDVAAETARQLARADQHAADQAESHAPAGAKVTVRRQGATVSVTVAMASRFGMTPAVQLHATSTAALEPGVAP